MVVLVTFGGVGMGVKGERGNALKTVRWRRVHRVDILHKRLQLRKSFRKENTQAKPVSNDLIKDTRVYAHKWTVILTYAYIYTVLNLHGIRPQSRPGELLTQKV